MNAVEIEEAISALAEKTFDATEFPFAFLQAFGNKETTLKRLRKGESNKSDLGGVLQTSNIHIAVAAPGEVTKMLAALKASPLRSEPRPNLFLPRTGNLRGRRPDRRRSPCRLCVPGLPGSLRLFPSACGDHDSTAGAGKFVRHPGDQPSQPAVCRTPQGQPGMGHGGSASDMNHFMARLIFCFFAEDTDIFPGGSLFTSTIETMSARDSSNTHEVIATLFLSLNTKRAEREQAGVPRWADAFPYVNGGLFSGRLDVPRFSKIARSYLLHIGSLDWTKINPDIFGSMIQAVSEEEERGSLGMHYTSVPNILKVLGPLFLDDLRARLAEADNNSRTLLNLRKRITRIRFLILLAAPVTSW